MQTQNGAGGMFKFGGAKGGDGQLAKGGCRIGHVFGDFHFGEVVDLFGGAGGRGQGAGHGVYGAQNDGAAVCGQPKFGTGGQMEGAVGAMGGSIMARSRMDRTEPFGQIFSRVFVESR